ncbi:MAG: hypothetical protein ACHP91_02090 [Burkholderiales bacterium]|jgi:hypothetical protein
MACAWASQAQTPLHVRGVVVRGGEMILPELPPMIVRTADGREVTVQVAINPRGADVRHADRSELVAGRYVGVIATGAPDSPRHAHAVILYPPFLAGNDEGERPWDAPPGSARVNGSIIDATSRDGALALTLRHGGHDSLFTLDEATAVVAVDDAGGFHAYPPGAHVFIDATRQRDGRITAGRVFVGKDGLVPPM